MKIEIELPDKFERSLGDIVGALQLKNKEKELTNESVLIDACKLFIIQQQANYLHADDEDEIPETPE